MRLRHLRLIAGLLAAAWGVHAGPAAAEVECTPNGTAERRSCDVALMQVAAVLCTKPGPEADAKWNAQVERCSWPDPEQLRERLDSACWTTSTELSSELRDAVPVYSCDPQMLVYEAYARLKACGERLECQVLVAPGLTRAALIDLTRTAEDPARPAWEASQGQAKQLLGELQKKTARITVKVSGKIPDSLRVTLGGEPLTLGYERYLAPGTLRLESSADGYQPQNRKLELRRGDRRTELLELEPLSPEKPPAAAPPRGPRRAPVSRPPAADPEPGPLRLAGWSSLLVGTTAVGVGLIFGALAIDKKSSAEGSCPANQCDDEGWNEKQTAETYADIATWTIGVGAVLAAGGGLALWLEPEQNQQGKLGRLGLSYGGQF